MGEIHFGGAIYRVDDLIELLEDRVQANTETEFEYEFYLAFQKMGHTAFFDKRFSRVIVGLIGGVASGFCEG